MPTARQPLTDAERGAWERAWQRVHKRMTRSGASYEDAREAAKAEAWRVVSILRRGGAEPDFGRSRVPAEARGAASRERQESTALYVNLSPESIAWLQTQAEAKATTVSQVLEQMIKRRKMR
jgi:hypothetical protein